MGRSRQNSGLDRTEPSPVLQHLFAGKPLGPSKLASLNRVRPSVFSLYPVTWAVVAALDVLERTAALGFPMVRIGVPLTRILKHT